MRKLQQITKNRCIMEKERNKLLKLVMLVVMSLKRKIMVKRNKKLTLKIKIYNKIRC